MVTNMGQGRSLLLTNATVCCCCSFFGGDTSPGHTDCQICGHGVIFPVGQIGTQGGVDTGCTFFCSMKYGPFPHDLLSVY